jgi:nitrate reductase gamma subunit
MHPDLATLPLGDWLHTALFGYYPYVCLAVMIVGSILRFDREQYSWRSGSSQMLRKKQLAWGSNLFHLGILFLFFGHLVGLLTPHAIYSRVVSAETKQWTAIIAGSLAGVACFAGLTLLMHRRFFDPRIRVTSTFGDNAVLVILWVQLVLGLLTVPFSLGHGDASVMLRLSAWAQGVFTFAPNNAANVVGLDWPYLVHLVLGLTIFLLFPFTRLVHMLSAPVWFLNRRGWQLVRTRNRTLPKRVDAAPGVAPGVARRVAAE